MNSYLCQTQWQVGCHLSFRGEILNVVLDAIENGMYTTQFFLGDPKNAWKRDKVTKDDILSSKEMMKRFPINLFSHYPFCANLAGKASKGGLAWDGDNSIDNKLRGVIDSLEYELGVISEFQTETNKTGVIIHPGSNVNRESGHLKVAETINKVNFPKNSFLILENCAGEGNKLCRNFSEIAIVLNNLDDDKLKHTKVCIDTAHLWGQGDYNLSEVSEIDRLFDDFDKEIGLQNWRLLHLNDAGVPLGSKKDVHACLGEGYIWKNNFDSLHHLLIKCTDNNIPMVLETEIKDMITLCKIINNK